MLNYSILTSLNISRENNGREKTLPYFYDFFCQVSKFHYAIDTDRKYSDTFQLFMFSILASIKTTLVLNKHRILKHFKYL